MIITQYAKHPAGAVTAGTLYEMRGQNLHLLPQNLVAISSRVYVDTDVANRYWPLHSISDDGTIAYFIQQNASNYSSEAELRFFATPLTPPRFEWSDYLYHPE